MKDFGFLNQNKNGTKNQADTSKKRTELLQALKKSDILWLDKNKKVQSLEYLRQGISIINFLIKNENNYQTKQLYRAKQKQFKYRLLNRQQQKFQQQCSCKSTNGDGITSYQQQKPKLIQLLQYSEKLWYEEGTTQLSIRYLKKAISIIDDILLCEPKTSQKLFCINKQQQLNVLLKQRLKTPNLTINYYFNYYSKADQLQKKPQLIQILKISERLWHEEGKQQQSLKYLRKAIQILDFIIYNEKNHQSKQEQVAKQKQLKVRLQSRQLQIQQ